MQMLADISAQHCKAECLGKSSAGNTQFQEVQSLNLAFNIEKSNRIDAGLRCQALKDDLTTAESHRNETNGQQMAIIAKLTDILHALPGATKINASHGQ